jgi:thiamine monophosphate kinase
MDFHIRKADHSVTPRQRDFCHIYEQYVQEKVGGKGDAMYDRLVNILEDYKTSNQDATTSYKLYGGEDFPLLIVIISPLMKRVHKYIEQSGELVFIDATSNTEKHNL